MILMERQDPTLETYLRTQPVARLATVDQNGRPHVVPICFVFDRGSLYSALDAKPKRVLLSRLRRVANIGSNPHVQVLVDEYHSDWSQLRYVQLRGVAELLSTGDERDGALSLLVRKYGQYQEMDLGDCPVIKVTVQSRIVWGKPLE